MKSPFEEEMEDFDRSGLEALKDPKHMESYSTLMSIMGEQVDEGMMSSLMEDPEGFLDSTPLGAREWTNIYREALAEFKGIKGRGKNFNPDEAGVAMIRKFADRYGKSRK